MGFDLLNLKLSYSSYEDDILKDFYIPALSEAVQYDRIAGFFSSASLSLAARGISGIIKNNGIMRVITSPLMNERDVEVIHNVYSGSNEGFENLLMRGIFEVDDVIQNDHLSAFYWLLSKGKLEIKIAVPKNSDISSISGLFHIKIGIMRDSNNRVITFSGSVNETASAWISNTEEFKVFDSVKLEQNGYCEADQQRFNALWNNKLDKVYVVDLPKAVKDAMIQRAPSTLSPILARIDENVKHNEVPTKPFENLSLFENQQLAVEKWFDNGRMGIFEMATGTGKTRTAIGCMIKCIMEKEVSIVVISAPQNTILLQWKKEIVRTGLTGYRSIMADSSNPNWHNDIIDEVLNLQANIDTALIVFTTHATLSSEYFIKKVTQARYPHSLLLICDEVHGIGALNSRKALINSYKYRLGLSATPERWFDETGSAIIMEYFGKVIYSFPISEALTTLNPLTKKPYLVHYYYYPIFVSLTDEELYEYQRLTNKLVRLIQSSKNLLETGDYMEKLLFTRANLYKKAINKLAVFSKLITEIQIKNTIIYTCDSHLAIVLGMLSQSKIVCHPFTQNESTQPCAKFGGLSEREYIINRFIEQDYSALVAIKCLDEGVDIPSADQAIIMTSSGNPREYIQRIGRIIRPCKGKGHAKIYDFIIKPNFTKLDEELSKLEQSIYTKELARAIEIAQNAINGMDAYHLLYNS